MKQIPNIFTLLNLFFGCIAVTYILQPGLIPLYTQNGTLLSADMTDAGTQYISIPQQMCMASLFIALAAAVDFFDGFMARWMKATSALGAQLDSLADVVSFGVAPSLIVYEFLRLSFAQQDGGLSINTVFLTPAFLIACAGAYRLARFNVDETKTDYFKGLPIPANGLLFAGFPLIYWTNTSPLITEIIISPWFWYVVIVIACWLMISNKPMLTLKFSNISIKKILPFLIIALFAVLTGVFLQWLAVPVSFVVYVILSFIFKQTAP